MQNVSRRTVQKMSHRYCTVIYCCDGYSYERGERRVLPKREPGISTLLCLMTKKDSEKEVERPHYYSQFWLDVAAGRRVIGAPKTDEGADGFEIRDARGRCSAQTCAR